MEVLAALEPSPFPVISLYLSLTSNQVGREEHQQFVRKVFNERAKGMGAESPERESFDKDVARIQEYLEKNNAAEGQAVAILRAAARIYSKPFRSKRRLASTRCSSARSRISIRLRSWSRTTRATRP